jgi:hypothetical protein
MLALLCSEPVSAGPVNFDGTKAFNITNEQGVQPTLTGERFVHAINSQATPTYAVYTANQNNGFNSFRTDDAVYKTRDGRNVLSLYNRAARPVSLRPESVNLNAVAKTEDSVTAGDATAKNTFDVTTLKAGAAGGSVNINGMGGEKGFAFSYASVTAAETAVHMKGRVDITAATLLQRAIPNPTFTKVVDPLNFRP